MIVIVAGPTASGKSALGVAIAQALNGEVVNVDSVQLYKDFIIGSASPSIVEQSGIPHHLIGVVEPTESFDIAQYLRMASSVEADLLVRNKLPVFVGGTSLYITGLLYGLTDLPRSNSELRAELERSSDSDLYEKLRALDPKRALQLHENDRVRVIRAIESCLELGEAVSNRYALDARPLVHDAVIVTPVWSRDELYRRIEARTKKMISDGLIEEVEAIVQKYGDEIPALRSIGYAEALLYINGKLSLDDVEQTIAMNTRRFAKRQMTWLRNQPQKMGWRVRPGEGDTSLTIEGDTGRFAKPQRLKHFSVWDIDQSELLSAIKGELGAQGVQMLFVPGPKVV